MTDVIDFPGSLPDSSGDYECPTLTLPSYAVLTVPGQPGGPYYVFVTPGGWGAGGINIFFLDENLPPLAMRPFWRIDVKDSMFEYCSLTNPRSGGAGFQVFLLREKRKEEMGAIEIFRIVETALAGDWQDPVFLEQCYDKGRAEYRKLRAALMGGKGLSLVG